MWGYLPSQAALLHPSPSLLTNSLCQALPQAAPCNYSPVPQTGEMGVRYTLCAELRKTTTVGPLFVNQTQGQNKMLSGTSWVLVIIIENCQAKEHFYWFPSLFIYLYHPGIFPDLCSAVLLSLSPQSRTALWTLYSCFYQHCFNTASGSQCTQQSDEQLAVSEFRKGVNANHGNRC